MAGTSIELERAVYTTWDHVGGSDLDVHDEVMELLRAADAALDSQPGFFFEGLGDQLVIGFENTKKRSERYFDVYVTPTRNARRVDLEELITDLKDRRLTEDGYRKVATESGRGIDPVVEYPFPDPVDGGGTGPHGNHGSARSTTEAGTGDGWSEEFQQAKNGPGTRDDADRGPAPTEERDSGHAKDRDRRDPGEPSTADRQTDRSRHDRRERRDGEGRSGSADRRGTEGYRDDPTDEDPTAGPSTDPEPNGDDTVSGIDSENGTDDPSEWEFAESRTDSSDDDEPDDDAEILDGGVPRDVELVAELVERYRRNHGEPTTTRASLGEVATFIDAVDGALRNVSFVSTPRSDASYFDFALGSREDSVAYDGLVEYVNHLHDENELRWRELGYEDELEHFVEIQQEALTVTADYDEVFDDARRRMQQLMENELRTARTRMREAVFDELSSPEDDSASVVSSLINRGDDESIRTTNVERVYGGLADDDIALDEERVEALAEHVSGRAAEEMADRIQREICERLETELRELTNEELVRLAMDSIRKSDQVVRTRSYQQYERNGGN